MFREIRTTEVRIKEEKEKNLTKESEKEFGFLKIKPTSGMTYEEACQFTRQLFMK